MKDYDKAISFSQKALEESPDNALALLILGQIYRGKEEYAKAISYFDNALSKDKSLLIHGDRGYCYYKLGRYNDAKADLKKSVEELYGNADNHYYLALTFEALGDLTNSIESTTARNSS